MRLLPSTGLLLLLLSTATTWGCADVDESHGYRRNVPIGTPHGSTANGAVSVAGHISSDGAGTLEQGLAGRDILSAAVSVHASKLGEGGQLTPVGEAAVKPGGAFDLKLPNDGSASGILILQARNVLGAVVGSGIVNGLPAFVEAIFIDATIDTATSFKAEVLVTLSKKGVPGVQNYLNVLDAFVDAQLANAIAVVGVLSTDLTALIGAVSDAVIATESVLVAGLQKAGIPVDATALTKSQASAVAGMQGLVTNATGTLVSSSKNLVAALQAATAKAAAPVDQAIFNAVVGASAVFNETFKKSMPANTGAVGEETEDVGFAASKSTFNLESKITIDAIEDMFKQAGVHEIILDALTKATGKLSDQIAAAKSGDALKLAKADFADALLGKDGGTGGSILQMLAKAVNDLAAVVKDVKATIDPLAQNLGNALNAVPLDSLHIDEALTKFDAGSKDLSASLKKVVSDKDANAVADAFKLAQKVIVL